MPSRRSSVGIPALKGGEDVKTHMPHKVGQKFEYQGIPYIVASVGQTRWTNSGNATKVFAINSTTGRGGRDFDLRDDGRPYRFSPD